MIRDSLMKELVPEGDETITPFVQHIQNMLGSGISSVLVMGGSSEYFSVANLIIQMKEYKPINVTERARSIVQKSGKPQPPRSSDKDKPVPRKYIGAPSARIGGKPKIKAFKSGVINFGELEIKVDGVEQIADENVTYTIAHYIQYVFDKLNVRNGITVAEVMAEMDAAINERGLDLVCIHEGAPNGGFKRPRMLDVVATVNRMRGLRLKK
jgi:predicted ABC-class ATPase